MKSVVVVTGGAGYIGSVIAYRLAQQDIAVVIIDHAPQPRAYNGIYYKADITDMHVWAHIHKNFTIDAVIHCAAYLHVGESVVNPASYYDNNVKKTITLLDIIHLLEIPYIIFSSSCAVYGIPEHLPLTEDSSCNPISPYGVTKYVTEYALSDYDRAYGIRYVSLRYFNAAGAVPEKHLGECHEPESHVIPLLFESCFTQQPFSLFGEDYPTPDGTCVRDYIHVLDLADAHVKAYYYLQSGGTSCALNVGTGVGYSVRSVIEAVTQCVKKSPKIVSCSRRPGDPPYLYANPTKAYKLLAWQPQHSSLEEIIESAYRFYERM